MALLEGGGKVQVLRDYLQKTGLRTLVETGLYEGRGSGGSCLDLLDSLVIIDISPDNCDKAGRNYPSARVIQGDSGEVLPAILPDLGPALFWLDAHAVTDDLEENHSPLLAELDAILAWPHAAQSVVLIDDVRMMGLPGWPTLDDVLALSDGWEATVKDDILRFE